MLRRNGAWVAGVAAVASIVSYSPRVDAQLPRGSAWQWTAPPASTVEIPTNSAEQQRQTRIEPALAGGLSAILPGAGQFYNGQKTKGLLMFAGFASAVVFAATTGLGDKEVCAGGAPSPSTCATHPSWPNSRFWIGFGGAAGIYAWSILDAIAAANRSRGPAGGGERGADVELGPRVQDGTLALAAGVRLRH